MAEVEAAVTFSHIQYALQHIIVARDILGPAIVIDAPLYGLVEMGGAINLARSQGMTPLGDAGADGGLGLDRSIAWVPSAARLTDSATTFALTRNITLLADALAEGATILSRTNDLAWVGEAIAVGQVDVALALAYNQALNLQAEALAEGNLLFSHSMNIVPSALALAESAISAARSLLVSPISAGISIETAITFTRMHDIALSSLATREGLIVFHHSGILAFDGTAQADAFVAFTHSLLLSFIRTAVLDEALSLDQAQALTTLATTILLSVVTPPSRTFMPGVESRIFEVEG